jgi:regulatory protein
MLEARSRGVAELRRLLIRKGEPEPEVDAAIERLRSSGILDDANFARQLTRSKAVGAGLSRRRIGQELAKRGVSRDVSDEAIAAVFDEEGIDEAASIDRVARKKLRMLTKVDDATRRRRLYAFLARRGYDSDAIGRVIQTLLAPADDADDAGDVDDVDDADDSDSAGDDG